MREIYPANSTQVRPGWIAGPGDNNHLLTYWVVRIDRGGEVLAPGVPDDYMQLTDVRDLAEWYIHIAETRLTGEYSAVGQVLSWAEWLYGIRAVTSSEVSFTWVDADFLLDRGAAPWMNIPLWWPARNDWGPSGSGRQLGGRGCVRYRSVARVGQWGWGIAQWPTPRSPPSTGTGRRSMTGQKTDARGSVQRGSASCWTHGGERTADTPLTANYITS